MFDKIRNYILCFIFLVTLFFLGIAGLFAQQKVLHNEKRKRASFPKWNKGFSLFTKQFNSYAKDNFGFRNSFVISYQNILWHAFKKSANMEVIRGKNDWLFYYDSVYLYEGKKSYKDISSFITSLNSFCEKLQGIPVYVVVVPNKAVVQQENLPGYVRKSDRRVEMMKLLQKSNAKGILDLYDLLRKNRDTTWRKYDTHWNSKGAYLAYQEIIAFLNNKQHQKFSVAKIKSRKLNTTPSVGLARMSGQLQLKESYEELTLEKIIQKNISEEKRIYLNENGKKKVVIAHDSFGRDYLNEYLANSFHKTTTIYNFYFSKMVNIILKEKPNFVLVEIVDRHLE